MFLSVRWGLEPPPSLLPGIVVATEEDSQPALWLKGDTFHPVTLYFGKKRVRFNFIRVSPGTPHTSRLLGYFP